MKKNLKKYKVYLPLLFVVFFFGCLPIDKEKEHEGTIKGVSLCIQKNKDQSDLISKTLIKQQCVLKHETDFTYVYSPKNLASVQLENNFIKFTSYALYNNLSDIVITSVQLEGYLFDDLGIRHSGFDWVKNLWVEPNQTFKTITLSLPIKYFGNTIKDSCFANKKTKSCLGSNIKGYKVLKIKLD